MSSTDSNLATNTSWRRIWRALMRITRDEACLQARGSSGSLLPDDIPMAYVTKENLDQGFERYNVRKMYHEQPKQLAPFLNRILAQAP